MAINNNNNRKSMQVNIFMPQQFVQRIDLASKETGSSRSEFIRRCVDYYLREVFTK